MKEPDLIKLIFDEKFDEAKEMLSSDVKLDLNFVSKKDNTALICAIGTNNAEIVEVLLKKGANPNFTTNKINLPLIEAIELSVEAEDYLDDVDEVSDEIVKLLVKYGADIYKANFDGVTPIDFAKDYHIPAQEFFKTLP